LSQARGYVDAEAVFLAPLLNYLGNMAFWCFPYGKDKEMDTAYQCWDNPQQTEEDVLGFPLTQALNKEWKLSEQLNELLTGINPEDSQYLDLQEAIN
jgi:hypothetical protein